MSVAYVGTWLDCFVGHVVSQYSRDWTDTDNPSISLAIELSQRWHPDVVYSDMYLLGWYNAIIQSEALRRAIRTYGADNLTGDNIRMAWETIENWDPQGLTGLVTYSHWDHQGNHSLRLARLMEGGKITPITDFIVGSLLTPEQRYIEYWLGE